MRDHIAAAFKTRRMYMCVYVCIIMVCIIERAHSLVMTFDIFGICIYSTYVYHSYCACVASSAIFKKKLNGKQAQHVAGIKLELAILQQRTTLSKLWNGTLDVA